MNEYDEELERVRQMTASKDFKDIFGDLPEVAPGVYASVREFQDAIFINVIWSAVPNKGNVGRYLDALPPSKRIVFPSAYSTKLQGMLIRRDYHFNEFSGCWIRNRS